MSLYYAIYMYKNILLEHFFVFQGHTDEEAELWLEEIQTAIDNANKDAQFGLKCKSYMN